jgi:hypothetical protein
MATDDLNIPGLATHTEHVVYSSYYGDNHIVQNALMVYPKQIVIDLLRREFSKDSEYTYRQDEYGFPLVRDLTSVDLDSNLTTRVLISDQYRYDMKFFPNIIVSAKGGTYKPLSANQNGTIKYRTDYVEDAYGDRKVFRTPTHRVYSGMWDLNVEVQINTESHVETEELTDLTAIMLQYRLFHELRAAGFIIKNLSVGAESAEQYVNDFIYSQSISISGISEWRVEIPVENVLERVVFNISSTKTPSNNSKSGKVPLVYSDLMEITEY